MDYYAGGDGDDGEHGGPRERVCAAAAGGLLLHGQRLPGEVRVPVPQSAHHPHLRVLQTLAGERVTFNNF